MPSISSNRTKQLVNVICKYNVICCLLVQTCARDEMLANGGSISHHHGGKLASVFINKLFLQLFFYIPLLGFACVLLCIMLI